MTPVDRPWEGVGSQCLLCRRRAPGSLTACEAFPGAIPAEIRLNIHDHREPWIDPETGEPGDRGIPLRGSLLFAPRPDVAPEALANLYRYFARPRVPPPGEQEDGPP